MRIGTLIILGSVLGPLAVRAQEVTPEFCNGVTAYVPGEGVAYQPGVDAEGHAVVPADLDEAGRITPPDSYSFDLFVRLNDAVTIDPGSNLEPIKDSEIGVGTVTVTGDQVYYNGQPLDSAQAHALAAACRELRSDRDD